MRAAVFLATAMVSCVPSACMFTGNENAAQEAQSPLDISFSVQGLAQSEAIQQLDQVYAALRSVGATYGLGNRDPRQVFRPERVVRDRFGITTWRMQQFNHDIPVLDHGALVHVRGKDALTVYDVNYSAAASVISVTPALAPNQAVMRAIAAYLADKGGAAPPHAEQVLLVIWAPAGGTPQLAYQVDLRRGLDAEFRYIDAHRGLTVGVRTRVFDAR